MVKKYKKLYSQEYVVHMQCYGLKMFQKVTYTKQNPSWCDQSFRSGINIEKERFHKISVKYTITV